MCDTSKFVVSEHVRVLSWTPQLELFSPEENPPGYEVFDGEDDDDEMKEIVITIDMSEKGMDLWRNPLTRDSIGEFTAEIVAIDERGYCTVRTSHAFRSAMHSCLFKRYERAKGGLPYPRTEDCTQSYLLSPFQLESLGPWTPLSRCDFLYGNQPHSISTLLTPFSSQEYCMHDEHGDNPVNAVKRIMVNHYGGVYELDACDKHSEYDGWYMEGWPWNGAKQKKTA